MSLAVFAVALIAIPFMASPFMLEMPAIPGLKLNDGRVGYFILLAFAAYRLLAFVISSSMTAVAGWLFAYYRGFVSIEAFALFLSIQYVAMIIIGGMGSLLGALLGAAFVTIFPYAIETLRKLLPNVQKLDVDIFAVNYASFAVVMILFLVLEPLGLVGIWRRQVDDAARHFWLLGIDDARVIEGAITFMGARLENRPPHEITCLGVARTSQHGEMFLQMSVLEILLTGRHARIIEVVELERYRHAAMEALPLDVLNDPNVLAAYLGTRPRAAPRQRSARGSALVGDPAEADRIEDGERTLADLNQTVAAKLRQHLADVHRREARRVRDVMLAQRKFQLQRIAVHHVAPHKPVDQVQDQARDALVRGAAPEVHDQLVGARLFLDPGLRQLLHQVRMLEQDVLQLRTLEAAILDVRHCLDETMRPRLEQQSGRNDVARQQERQDLAAAVGQHNGRGGPAGADNRDRVVHILLATDDPPRGHREFGLAEVVRLRARESPRRF